MKKVKKLVSLLMIMSLTFSMLTACGSKGQQNNNNNQNSNEEQTTEKNTDREPVSLTVYSQTANYSGQLTGWFAQVLKEKFNVTINVIPDADGVYDTRMEAGDLGDIVIWGTNGDDYLNAIDAGLLFDWEEEDLISEYGPYIKEHMPFALESNKELSGGKLYGFGHAVATSSEDHQEFFYTWDLRWDLYKQLGYPEVKSLDDYVTLLEKMKEICPKDDNGNPTYAVSLWPDWDGTMVMYVKSTATAYYGYDELGMGHYDPETGVFYPALDNNSPYLEMLKFYNELYRKGLLDPDSMTQTYDQMIAKVQNGGTFFSIFNYSGSLGYNTDAHVNENKMMCTFTPAEATPIVYGMNVYGGNRIWSIGAKTQYPELCMEIIDWLSTPEGRMVSEYGPKGVTWDYDAEGNTIATELGKLCHFDRNTEMTGGYSGKFNDGANQLNNITWSLDAENPDSNGETYNYNNWKSNQIDARCDIEADWRTKTGANNTQEYLDKKSYKLAVGTTYAESLKDAELKVTWEQVIKAITDYSWKAIYATTPEEYDNIVAEMITVTKGYGYDKCIDWSKGEAAKRLALENEVKGK